MHGAYDQMKWRGQEEEFDNISKRSLPKCLHIASENVVPWPRCSFDDDFILIAEFSENEGPRPVQTIPTDGGGTFDTNAFAVHVMSVDYQSQGRDDAFSIAEDTQLFLTDRQKQVYAYVHHFTLYDIHARGFVRPFCMCYLSHCKRKILACLDHMMEEFSKVSRLFSFGNRIVFSRDLQQRLVDLVALRGEVSEIRYPLDKQAFENMSYPKHREHYNQVWKETRKIIKALKPHMNDPRIMQQFKQLESLAEGRGRSFTVTETRTHESPEQKNFVRYTTRYQEQQTTRRRARSLSDLDDLQKNKAKNSTSARTFTPAYLHNVQQLRNLHELCEWGAKEGLNRLRSILKYFTQEAIALSIEKTETNLIEPTASLLTVGRSVVLNFLHKVDLKCVSKQYCTIPSVYLPHLAALDRKNSRASSGSCYSLDSFKSCLEEDITGSARSSDGILSPFMSSLSFHLELHADDSDYEKSDSDTTSGTTSSEVIRMRSDSANTDNLSSGEYCVNDDSTGPLRQTSVTEVNRHKIRINPLTRKSYSLENLPSMLKTKTEPRTIDHKERQVKGARIPFLVRECVRAEKTLDFSARGGHVPGEHGGECLEQNDKKPAIQSLKFLNKAVNREGWSRSAYPQCKSNLAKTKDCLSLSPRWPPDSGKVSPKRIPHISRIEKVPFRCYAEEVCHPSPVVSNILDFRNNYSFGVHLLFSLMIGRPVVIMAESHSEREVRYLISALWTFIPENTSHGRVVIPWRKKALHITDLPYLKLAGLCKNRHSNMLPKSVKRYVSVLDFETSCIITPPYKGIFLSSIFNYRNCWPTNASLQAFIHSLFLELASKAYVYYYVYCLGSLQICACKGDRSVMVGTTLKAPADEIDIMSKLGVHFSDAKIVQHLGEVVKQQQVDYHLLDEQEQKAPTIVADLCQCIQLRNVPPLDLLQ